MSNAITVFETQLAPLRQRFAAVLPPSISPDRLIRTVVISVERLPKLLDCDRQSLFNAAMSAAVLGLEVDGVTGQAYLLPFKGKAQLVIGYRGINTMAARSGITITGAVVRDGDEFDYELGSSAYIKHVPQLGNKGRIAAAWAVAAAHGRPSIIAVMGIDDLLAVKSKSPGAQRSDSPWNDPTIGFPAMCEKTVKRRLARSLPLNIMTAAARMDEAFEEQGANTWISPDKGVVIDGDISPRHNTETPTAASLIGETSPHVPPADKLAAPPATDPAGGADFESDSERLERLDGELAEAASHGMQKLHLIWMTIPPADRKILKAALDTRYKPAAEKAGKPAHDPETGEILDQSEQAPAAPPSTAHAAAGGAASEQQPRSPARETEAAKPDGLDIPASIDRRKKAAAPDAPRSAAEYESYATAWIEELTDPETDRWVSEIDLRSSLHLAPDTREQLAAMFKSRIEQLRAQGV